MICGQNQRQAQGAFPARLAPPGGPCWLKPGLSPGTQIRAFGLSVFLGHRPGTLGGCNPRQTGFAGDYLAGWARGLKSPASWDLCITQLSTRLSINTWLQPGGPHRKDVRNGFNRFRVHRTRLGIKIKAHSGSRLKPTAVGGSAALDGHPLPGRGGRAWGERFGQRVTPAPESWPRPWRRPHKCSPGRTWRCAVLARWPAW